MVKKIFSLLMTVVMLVALIPAVYAADFTTNTQNLYYKWGDFETSEQAQQAQTSGETKTTTITHVDGGADGSAKALQVTMATADSADYVNFHFPGVANENYTVSFWLKTSEAAATSISVIFSRYNFGKKDEITLPIAATNGTWSKYEFTWTCSDADTAYRSGSGGVTNIRIKLNGVTAGYTYCFDRLSVVPEGLVTGYYDSINVHYDSLMGTLPQEPEYGIKETTEFSDISTHWAKPAIVSLAAAGYLSGKDETTYAPNDNVTRAEFLKMALGVYDIKEATYDGRFADVTAEKWYAPVVQAADINGLIANELKADGKIYPEQAITREEAASIVAAAAVHQGATLSGATVTFTDEADIADWAKTYVKNAVSYGVISGYDDGTFLPKNNVTRAEAAQMLLNVVEITTRLNIYVDADAGNDANRGTSTAPLATVEAARDMAATYSDSMKNDIRIYIRGEHYFDETFTMNETHSGKNGYNIIYTSWGTDKAIFTMAKKYTGFSLHDSTKNIWKTYVGTGARTRQAYFNEVKGIRSRTVGYLDNCELYQRKYYLCDNTELLDIAHPEDVDIVCHILWVNPVYKVKSIAELDGRVQIVPSDYFLNNQYRLTRTDCGKQTNRKMPSYLENAYEFLDQQGEWYLNEYDGFMYYIPRNGEDMETMECKIPFGEDLIDARGTSYDAKLTNVTFDNILFEGTTGLRVDEVGGYAPIQNGLLTGTREASNDGKTGQSIGASMHFERCENIIFSNNVIRHMGNTCLEFIDGAQYITIEGNEFYESSSHAILIDDVSLSGWRKDKNQDNWCEYININNNYIHHVARDYKTSAAVGIGYVRHADLSHNEISYVPNSGYHIGWDWTKFANTGTVMYDVEVSYNYIHDCFYDRVNDGAPIYTLGASSAECDTIPDAPNSGLNKNRIIGNYIVNTWNSDGVYPDQGSTSWYIANNVFDKGEYVINETYNFDRTIGLPEGFYWSHMHKSNIGYMTYENNYATHNYGSDAMKQSESSVGATNIYADRSWPEAAQAIIVSAGIEEKYRDNFNLDGAKIFVGNNKWQTVTVGNSVDPGLYILGDDNASFSLSDYDIRWWFDDPTALTYENGAIIARKAGTYEAEVWAVVDGIDMCQHYMFECVSAQ